MRAAVICMPAALIDALCALQLAAYGRMEGELAQRAAAGRIVEAHGDLRPEHICLTRPPCVIDSLEFSFDLRTLDPLDPLDPLEELGYFSIECEQMRARSAAEAVVAAWRDASQDPAPARLCDFYCIRRATVRAKVIAWRLLDPQVREQAPWSARAQALIAAAIQHARWA